MGAIIACMNFTFALTEEIVKNRIPDLLIRDGSK